MSVKSEKSCSRMLIEAGACFALLTALFWSIWSLFTSVPALETIASGPSFLPLSANRWWDVIGVFLLTIIGGYTLKFLLSFSEHIADYCFEDGDLFVPGVVAALGTHVLAAAAFFSHGCLVALEVLIAGVVCTLLMCICAVVGSFLARFFHGFYKSL